MTSLFCVRSGFHIFFFFRPPSIPVLRHTFSWFSFNLNNSRWTAGYSDLLGVGLALYLPHSNFVTNFFFRLLLWENAILRAVDFDPDDEANFIPCVPGESPVRPITESGKVLKAPASPLIKGPACGRWVGGTAVGVVFAELSWILD